jgi:DHA1 family bicyclomycin/chloramphenicol resistance-like MFS transporter/DHA1 family 2-module integral membrane pump EmrD-like MFS transporter
MSPKILIFLVIVLSGCLAGISSEIYIPSLPAISDDLKITIDEAQYTIAIFMLGLSISQLIYGPISDVIGRRLPLIIGILIMISGSFICFYTTNITTLLLGRFIQGLGAGAGASLWRAIFRDSFNGAELAKYGGYTNHLK